jgi:hypothetical protein
MHYVPPGAGHVRERSAPEFHEVEAGPHHLRNPGSRLQLAHTAERYETIMTMIKVLLDELAGGRLSAEAAR